jgi:hypothetical protein
MRAKVSNDPISRFTIPYTQRPCPEGLVPEVWKAFAEAAEERDREESLRKWAYYRTVHNQYYNPDGTRKTDKSDGKSE